MTEEWRVRYRTWHRTASGTRVDDHLSTAAVSEEHALELAETYRQFAEDVAVERREVTEWKPATDA